MAHRALQLLANEPAQRLNGALGAAPQRRIGDMKAIFIRRYGGPEMLEYGEFPNPVVGSGNVLIKVAAAAINPIDIMERSGLTKDSSLSVFQACSDGTSRGFVTSLGGRARRFGASRNSQAAATAVRHVSIAAARST